MDRQRAAEGETAPVGLFARLRARCCRRRRHRRERAPPVVVDPDAELSASWFSILTFQWVGPLIARGAHTPLQLCDLPRLSPADSSNFLRLVFGATYRAVAAADQSRGRSQPRDKRRLSDASAAAQLSSAASHDLSDSPYPPDLVARLSSFAARIPARAGAKTSRALFPVVARPFVRALLFKPAWLVAAVGQVLLIRTLVSRLGDAEATSSLWAFVPAVLAMTCATLVLSVTQHGTFTNAQHAGMRARAAVTATVYHKLLRLAPSALATVSDGELGSFLVTDPQRILDSYTYITFTLFACIELPVIFGLLAIDLGLSALLGAGLLALLVPTQLAFASYTARARARVSERSDVRVQKMNELLSGIRMVKLSAWEPHFERVVSELRAHEVKHLKTAANIRSLNGALFFATPILVTLTMFTSHTLLFRRVLTPQVAFSALGYVSMITRVLTLMPLGWLGASEASVATRRLDRFFDLPELPSIPREERLDVAEFSAEHTDKEPVPAFKAVDYQTAVEPEAPCPKGQVELTVSHASFSHDIRATEQTNDMATVLHDVSLSAGPGDLVCVVGPVGSGKSSLLQGMLGEIRCTRGAVSKRGRVAYCAQQPWIVNGTLRENIVMFGDKGTSWDPEWYELVVERCCLGPDIAALPASDLTEIGERGINLSGGQKARMALARAVYSKADIFLLDDPISALDAAVAAKVLRGLIGPDGLLANKTQIVVTHSIHVLPFASKVVVLSDGSVTHSGTFEELRQRGVEFSGLTADDLEDIGAGSSSNECEDSDTDDVDDTNKEEDLKLILRDANVDISPFEESLNTAENKDMKSDKLKTDGFGDDSPVLEIEADVFGKLPTDAKDTGQRDKLVVEEDRKFGMVESKVYDTYIKAGGGYISLVFVATLFVLSQAVRQYADVWVADWTTSISADVIADEAKLFAENRRFMLIFLGLSLGTLLLTMLRAAVLTERTMKASRTLHDQLIDRVLHARPSFFDTNPIGRILNRFSKDMDQMDTKLPPTAQDLLQVFMVSLGAVVTISVILPWFLLCIVPVVAVFMFLQKRYKRSSRELKRLDGISFSPLYSHFVESSVGLATIRAHRVERAFGETFNARIDENNRAYYMFNCAGRWLGVRLDMISACFTLVTGVVVLALGDSLNSGLAGVALTQSILMTGTFQWGVRQAAEAENLFTSVERVANMASDTAVEGPFEVPDKKPPQTWPSEGEIAFDDVTLRYRPELDPALHGLSFRTRPRERVGIVGRTGSGKSSLFVALFRMVELSGGSISIDGVDISTIGLHDLRSSMAIVPQDPVLFNGTIRSNLDPSGKLSDAVLWDAIRRVHMADALGGESDDEGIHRPSDDTVLSVSDIDSVDGGARAAVDVHVGGAETRPDASGGSLSGGRGLDLVVNEKGSNFSAGERQLLSLARAIVSGVRVVVLDEASASLDNHTDMLVQRTVREQLSDRTVLTIAHRLATIADSDRVLVVDDGEVVEFDTPTRLVSKGGYFKRLVEETGPVESAIVKAIIAQAAGTEPAIGSAAGGEGVERRRDV